VKAIRTVEAWVTKDIAISEIHVVQYDTGRQIEFIIMDMEIPTDAKATVWIKKADGKLIYNSCEVSSDTVLVTLTNQALAVEGRAYCQVRLECGSDVVSTFNFVLRIKAQISGEGTESQNEATALEEMFNALSKEIKEASAAANTATTNAKTATTAANTAASNAQSIYNLIKDTEVGDLADKINNIGGTNYIPNSKLTENYTEFTVGPSLTAEVVTSEYVRISKAVATASRAFFNTSTVLENDTYTLSGWIYIEETNGSLTGSSFFVRTYKTNSDIVGDFINIGLNDTDYPVGQWFKISGSGIPGSATDFTVKARPYLALADSFVGKVRTKKWKLEKGKVATDWSPAPEDVIDKIDNLRIGGRNLYLYSADFSKGWATNNVTNISIIDSDVPMKGTSAKTYTWTNTSTISGIYQRFRADAGNTKFTNGQKYAVSFWIKASSQVDCYVEAERSGSSKTFKATTNWQYVTYTFTGNGDSTTVVFYGKNLSTTAPTKFSLSMPMLVEGDAAVSWSPAPEDVATQLATKKDEEYGLFVDYRATATTGYWHKLLTCKINAYSHTDINMRLSIMQLYAYATSQPCGDLIIKIRQGANGESGGTNNTKLFWANSTVDVSSLLNNFAMNVVADSAGNYVELYIYNNLQNVGYKVSVVDKSPLSHSHSLTFAGEVNNPATTTLTSLPTNGTIVYSTLGYYPQKAADALPASNVKTETGTLSLTDNQTKTSVSYTAKYTKTTVGEIKYIEIDLEYTFVPSTNASSLWLYGFPAPKQATSRMSFSTPELPCPTGHYQIPNGFFIDKNGNAHFILLALGNTGLSGQWGWNTQAGKTHALTAHFGYYLA